LFDFAFSSNSQQETILVIGNEISGIDPQLLSLADHVVHLPMAGKKTSLNAAVAAGIALYHLVFQNK
jgi:TrmH family RNA methyltransferase